MAVPEGLLKQARASGQLNLSNRHLAVVPEQVWRVNVDAPQDAGAVSFDSNDRWWEQVGLSRLIMASNELTEIADGVAMLQNLTVLDVHDNQIAMVSPQLATLQEMKAVNLSQNQLREFPACLLNLQQLQSLRFSDNQLTALPSTIGQLTQLTELVSSCDKR